MHLEIENCICYNAVRLKDRSYPCRMATKTPERHLRGSLFPFLHGGLNHRLVTDYSSLSNHLQMRWLTTLATTAMTKDRNNSMSNTPFPYQSRGGNRISIPQFDRIRHDFFCSSVDHSHKVW